jgi:hypothetical protein
MFLRIGNKMTKGNDLLPKTTSGYPPLYALSTLLFVMALGGVVALVVTDNLHHFSDTGIHQRLDAWPLIMIGSSYIMLNIASGGSRREQIKGVFLGAAFLLWGAEQLLPPSRLAVLLDEAAVTIFVVDVSVIIWSRISLSDGSMTL